MDSRDEVVCEAGLNIKYANENELSDESLDEDKLCDSCETEKKSATKYCNDCEIHLCNACLSYHEKFKATRDHKVDTIEPKVKWFCDKHVEKYVIDRYCVGCSEACCLECSNRLHAHHELETSETMINSIKDCKNYLRYLNKIKEEVIENANNVCGRIDENTELLIKQVKDKSLKMKINVERSKNENLNEIIKYENKIRLALNKLDYMKNDFIKKRQITKTKGLSRVGRKYKRNINIDGARNYNIKTILANATADENSIADHCSDIQNFFKDCKLKYVIEARLNNISLEFGLSYSSMSSIRLFKRIPVSACRLMAIDQPSNCLFVISNSVHSFNLNDFQETLHTDIPLFGDLNDFIAVKKGILFSRSNKTFLNAFSFHSKTDKKLDTYQYIIKLHSMSTSQFICINKLHSAAKVYHLSESSESETDSFSIYLSYDVKSDISNELLLDCIPFNDFDLLGCFQTNDGLTSQLKLVGSHSGLWHGCSIKYKGVWSPTYTIPDIILKHNSTDVVMARDKKNKLTIISEGNKLLLFSDNFKSSKPGVQFVNVGDINLAEYNINEPSKILCDEAKSRLFVMSKTSQEILVFDYKVTCSEYI